MGYESTEREERTLLKSCFPVIQAVSHTNNGNLERTQFCSSSCPILPLNAGIDKQAMNLKNCYSQNQLMSIYLLGLLVSKVLLILYIFIEQLLCPRFCSEHCE